MPGLDSDFTSTKDSDRPAIIRALIDQSVWLIVNYGVLPAATSEHVFIAEPLDDRGRGERDGDGIDGVVAAVPATLVKKRGLFFTPPPPPPPIAPPPLTKEEIAAAKQLAKAEAKQERERSPRFKHDPKLVEAARELRDKYTEQINAGLLLPPSSSGTYDVSRQLDAAPTFKDAMKLELVSPPALLDAA